MCETWQVRLREDISLRYFENKTLVRILKFILHVKAVKDGLDSSETHLLPVPDIWGQVRASIFHKASELLDLLNDCHLVTKNHVT
jgi:hypothetical protein